MEVLLGGRLQKDQALLSYGPNLALDGHEQISASLRAPMFSAPGMPGLCSEQRPAPLRLGQEVRGALISEDMWMQERDQLQLTCTPILRDLQGSCLENL